DAVTYVSPDAAQWFADHDVSIVGADNPAVERTALPGKLPPLHEVLLCELGMYLLEMLTLREPALAGVTEGLLVVAPLRITRGVNSPVNPLLIV
ncbi:MAG: cyclase family protein, partial [Acidimicrobiales bacterium]